MTRRMTRILHRRACMDHHGTPQPAVVRWGRDRAAALAAGWPAGCTRATAGVLGLLFRFGELTWDELALVRGRARRPTLRLLHAARREGWVCGRFEARRVVWSLAPAVRLGRERHLARAAEECA